MSTDQARVVVIGGGITGCSVAYHLALAGWSDVLLVEKAQLTAGSTCQAAGLVTAFNPSSTMMAFRRYSIELYGRLGAFEAVGSLRLASSPDQLRELERTASRARGIGLEAGVIGADEARRLMPAISPDALYGAVHLAGDGYLDPHGATHAVADAARALGVRIRTGLRVTGIELSPRREVTAVLTEDGPIATEIVVNAAGMWAPQVAAMVGAFIPSTPVDHQHVALKAVPGHELPRDMPCFRDPDNLVYGKSEQGGMVFGGYETDPGVALGGRRPLGPRRALAAARLGTVRTVDGRGHPPLPVPRRRGGDPARLPPRRDDARRQSAAGATPRRPRLLGRRGPVAQRVRGRRRDRPRDRGLDHRGRPGGRHRAVSSVAFRRGLSRPGVRGRPRARDVLGLLPAALPVRRGRDRPAETAIRPPWPAPGGGRGLRHQGRLGTGRPSRAGQAVAPLGARPGRLRLDQAAVVRARAGGGAGRARASGDHRSELVREGRGRGPWRARAAPAGERQRHRSPRREPHLHPVVRRARRDRRGRDRHAARRRPVPGA